MSPDQQRLKHFNKSIDLPELGLHPGLDRAIGRGDTQLLEPNRMTRHRPRLGPIVGRIGHFSDFGLAQKHPGRPPLAEGELGRAGRCRQEGIEKLLPHKVAQQLDRLAVREILGHIPRRMTIHEGEHGRVLERHGPDEHIANAIGLERRTEVQPDQGPVLSALTHVVQKIVHRLGTHDRWF